MNELEKQKSMLNDELLVEQNRKKYNLQPSDIIKFLDSFIGNINDPDTRRKLLDFFVDKIYVYPDKLALALYYSDDRRELPFEETEKLIDNRKDILSMLNGQCSPSAPSEKMLDGLIENREEKPDFFL